MSGSKLEKYVAILQLLLSHGPLPAEDIEFLIPVKQDELRKDLNFLLERNMVNRTSYGNSQRYKTSVLGDRLVEYFVST